MSDIGVTDSEFSATVPWWADVWRRYGDAYERSAASGPADETGIRRELVFCLLGGHGVTYELGLSATEVVMALQPFAVAWSRDTLQGVLEHELRSPQFEPRRVDGTLRRYRFPVRKARLVTMAVMWAREQGMLEGRLAELCSEQERRRWLCGCPGVGMKTASWMLRNCGWARELAVLDVHLLRALDEVGLLRARRLPRDYECIERDYLEWAATLEACPAALDLFLWDVQRTAGEGHRNRASRPPRSTPEPHQTR